MRDNLSLSGYLTLRVYEKGSGILVAERRSKNLLVNVGLQAIAQASTWAAFQDYNLILGNPFQSGWGNLGPLYGALGSSNVPVNGAQTQLGLEIGRVGLSNGSLSGTGITMDFFFGTQQANGNVFEAGIFVQAGITQAELSAALVANTEYASLSVSALSGGIPSGAPIIVNYGNSITQTVTSTTTVASGATSIPVGSFVANFNYPVGSTASYLSGTLLDRTVFSTPYTKANDQVATLELDLAMLSTP